MTILPENLQKAVYRLAKKALHRGFKLEALHEYRNREDEIIYHRIRLKHPITREKYIRPMKFIDGKGYVIGEPNFQNGKPLYNLHSVDKQSNVPVWICEGEWCVDALTSVGILSTTSGSADSVNKADWEVLAGRKIVIWPDNDASGKRFAQLVANILQPLGCQIWQVNVETLNLPIKGDVVDWLEEHPTATIKEILSLPMKEHLSSTQPYSPPEEKKHKDFESNSGNKKKQSLMIVNFVMDQAELFHDKNGEVYAFDLSTKETRRLDGRQFRDWLVANFYEINGNAPRDQSLREAMSTLMGLARYKGECREVYIRVAKHVTSYYVDLAEIGQSRAICITSDDWKIVNEPPVRFLRPETIRPLPTPISGGDFSQLWQIANIPKNQRILVVTWLIDCLRPDTPFPVLELIGEQGSAKSTTQMLLRRLVDPNASDLRAAPKTVEDIFVTGGVNWLVSYENISHLSPQMQDALCVLATGGGYAKRKLYSDADESVIIVKRPIILNGISASITSQDLIDRAISVETPVISLRTESNKIWEFFEEKHAEILGALLDIFALSLSRLHIIKLPSSDCPRLIEFTRLGMSVAEILGHTGEEFLRDFNTTRYESIARTIDASPVATALIEWFEKHNEQGIVLPVKTLFEQVEIFKPSGSESWPRSAKGFADALRRAAPALRQMGIECRSLGKVGSFVSWEIKQR